MKLLPYLAGMIFGLIAPYVGLFIGLQVSPALGNLLAFPFLIVTMLTGIPFGMWPVALWLLAVAMSVALWTAFFALISRNLSQLLAKI